MKHQWVYPIIILKQKCHFFSELIMRNSYFVNTRQWNIIFLGVFLHNWQLSSLCSSFILVCPSIFSLLPFCLMFRTGNSQTGYPPVCGNCRGNGVCSSFPEDDNGWQISGGALQTATAHAGDQSQVWPCTGMFQKAAYQPQDGGFRR